MNREELVKELTLLYALNKAYQDDIRARMGDSEEVGYLTRYTAKIAGYIPKMIEYDIKPWELKLDENKKIKS